MVVVVEDDASMSQAIERILGLCGFRAASFSSAEALLESGVARDALCFVLDFNLPGLSGLELRQKLVSEGLHAPAIFITAYDDPGIRRQIESTGAVAYLSKPFAGTRLIEAVRQALQISRPIKSP